LYRKASKAKQASKQVTPPVGEVAGKEQDEDNAKISQT
jgi:hypothetical protein